MMGSQPVQSIIDPATRSKMPLLEGTIASTGLSKPGSPSGFLHKQTLQYSGAYYTHDPRVKDGVEFSKTSLLNGRSPVSHLSGTEGKNHIVYRPDNKTFSDESHSYSSSVRDLPGQQGFTYYIRSPNVSSPTSPVAVRNQTAGGLNLSPPPENSVYLAIPKPVYGHSPCCSELGCTLGHRYSMEHGSQRMPNILNDGEWIHSTAQYNHPAFMQGKAPEALLQPRSLQREHNTERLPFKDQTGEQYHGLSPNSTARTFPAYMEPNYRSYPCIPTHTLLGPLTEERQHLQISPKGYHGLHLSHPPTYEHMTSLQHGIPSQVYQDRSPMSKYGQLTQRPMFYYPQANMEVESGAVYIGAKHIEDVVPTIHRRTLSSSQGHYLVSEPILSEVPMPSPIAPPNHPFLRGFDHPSYSVHRMNLNASQMRAHLKRPCAPPSILHANDPSSSPSRTLSSVAIHLDQSNASLHTDRPCASPPSLHVERPNSYLHVNQPSASPVSIQINRGVSSGSLSIERLLDYSQHQAQVTYLKQAQGHAASPRALSQSPVHHGNLIHKAVNDSADPLRMTCSPAVVTRKEYHASPSSLGTDVCNGGLKRSGSRTPTDRASPLMKKVKEENGDLFEINPCKKRQKMGMERVGVVCGHSPDSPPMPIIDSVFSLAPYKVYLEASGMLLPAKEPQRADKPSEPCAVKPEPYSYVKSPKRHGQQPVLACLASKDEKLRSSPDTPKEKPAVEMLETKHIKMEKMDPQDKDSSVETVSKLIQDDHRELTVKEEVEEIGSSDCGLMLVVRKCEPDELEYKPFIAVKDGAADECKAGHLTADIRVGSTQSNAKPTPEQTVVTRPKSTTPLQPPENKLHLQNIPPQCLKLSTYKIVLPDILRPTPALPTEKPPVNPLAEAKLILEVQKPVRQHFFELHQSLCKLVSSCVSGSQEQELRTWVSQLELTEPASTSFKVQKVSRLLGVKAREVWMNEEIKTALLKVLHRLREYIAQEHCPFPHVMRTGAVFIPILVVKELLFPQVLGVFINQVLQEHKVELRPTTLSEEKILTQLHKRAGSSKLRRLLSLKHLPDIYADVLNLFYHACVCKRLGVELVKSAWREPDEGSDETDRFRRPIYSETIASPVSSPEPQRRLFLEASTLSKGEEVEYAEQAENGGIVNTFSKRYGNRHSVGGNEDGGNECMAAEEDPSVVIPQEEESIDSWTRPLTSDELSLSTSDTEADKGTIPPHVSQSSGSAKCQARSRNPSCMILKLRKVLFNKGHNGRKARYQAISDPEMVYDPPYSKNEDRQSEEAREGRDERDHKWITSKVTHRWQRMGGFSHALRPLTSSSKRRHRSLIKIKYCPYLSTCHSAEHRRRWVLRSAVQRARRAMKVFYPDLVGKRIRHLYEEKDKSEVWYRGEVVCVHEAHPNPLKTVFEVRYDSEPEWKYYLELLIDYKKGWLKIED